MFSLLVVIHNPYIQPPHSKLAEALNLSGNKGKKTSSCIFQMPFLQDRVCGDELTGQLS